MSGLLYILRILRVAGIIIFAAGALTMSCRRAMSQTSVTIDATQWAELIDSLNDSVYDTSVANWSLGTRNNTLRASAGGSGDGVAEGAWQTALATRAVSNLLFSSSSGHAYLQDVVVGVGDVEDAVDNVWVRLDEVGDDVSDIKTGVGTIHGDLTNLNSTAGDIAWDVDSLASWGTPDTGPGIRVQIANVDPVTVEGTVAIDVNGSYAVNGYDTGSTNGSTDGCYPVTTNTVIADYEWITNRPPLTNGLTISTNDPSGGLSGSCDMGLTPSSYYELYNGSWSALLSSVPMPDIVRLGLANATNALVLSLDWHAVTDDPAFWSLLRSNLTIAYLFALGIFLVNIYRTMG